MVFKTKSGEYFGLAEKIFDGDYLFNSLPDNRPMVVYQYSPSFGSGRPEVKIISRKFLKGYLQKVDEDFPTSQEILNLIEEDIMSNSNSIIELAKSGDVAKVEEALQSAIGQAIKRALWVAEKKDEFTAIPVLQDLQTKYGGVKTKQALAPKDSKSVKLTKSDKVDDRVWQAILNKANKIGAVTKSTSKNAECSIEKTKADTFIKALKGIAGITVDA